MGLDDLFVQFAKYGIIRKPKESYGFTSEDLEFFLDMPLEPLYEATAYSFNRSFGKYRNVGAFTPPFNKGWVMLSTLLVFLALNGNSNSEKLLNDYNFDIKMLNFIREYIKSTDQLNHNGFLLPKYTAFMTSFSLTYGVGPLFSYDAAIIGSFCDYRILEMIGKYYMGYSEKDIKKIGKIFAKASKYVKKRYTYQ